MKKVQNTLVSIADALQKLSKQFKAASKELDKLKKSPKKKAKAAAKKTVKSKAKAKTVKKTAAKKTKKASKSKAASAPSVIDAVFSEIKKTRKGITISEIKAKTKLESRQISNAVYKLSKRGQIKTAKRGVYVKK